MRVRYINTLYGAESCFVLAPGQDIEFKDGKVRFNWAGMGVELDVDKLISIEQIEG